MKAVESKLTDVVGADMAQSLLKNNLAKLKKDVKNLTTEDCLLLIVNILEAVSLFVTKNESKWLKSELENLLKTGS